MLLLIFVLKTRDIRLRLLMAYCAVPLHCRQTHECLDASAQGGGEDFHVLGSVPEPAGDGPPGAVIMSGDRGGGGTGWGRRQSHCLTDGAAASAAAFAVYVNSAGGEEDGKAGHAAATAPLIVSSMLLIIVAVRINAGQRRSIKW